MPKLKPETAIFRVIDKHTYKEGVIFRELREQCLKWGMDEDTIESTVQNMLDLKEIEEPVIGYIRRMKEDE